MTTVKRGRPRSEAIDAAIRAAAIEEFVERGFLAFSMEGVAARADVAKTTLYRRWASPLELVVDVMRSFERHPPEPPEGAVRDQLLWLLDDMRARWNDPQYAAMVRRAAADRASAPELYDDTREQLVGPYLAAMTEVLRRGVREGLIRPDIDITWVRQMLLSPILASALTFNRRVSKAQVQATVDTVLRGVAR